MATNPTENTAHNWICAGQSDELRSQGIVPLKGIDRPLAVVFHDGRWYAFDNRCPHLGFPLHRGSVRDGILTCHWHHARFDLASGCTFDLFADDVPSYEVEERDGMVWVGPPRLQGDAITYWQGRLEAGLTQNIGLVIAKATIALLRLGWPVTEIIKTGTLFGTRERDSWASGLTSLTSMANLAPHLDEENVFLALYQGLRRVAAEAQGTMRHRDLQPLGQGEIPPVRLQQWFRYWISVRHRDGAERTLLTALERGAGPGEIAAMIFTAATDRFYADSGHALDFANKACEVLDLIGWEHAPRVLPSVLPLLAQARGGEETNSWRHPIDLVALLNEAFENLPAWREGGKGGVWQAEEHCAEQLLADDPWQIIAILGEALRAGARPQQLSKALCYAAALRVARFGTANEFGDWITALHTFTYCNAVDQVLSRLEREGQQQAADEVLRGVFHGAMAVYLDRFLNVPPGTLPELRQSAEGEGSLVEHWPERFLQSLDSRHLNETAAEITAKVLRHGGSTADLTQAMARGALREDADFHTYQMLEAGLRQYAAWGDTLPGRRILVAVTRYLAAHAPTQRAQLQTAEIALRLHRGDTLYEE